MEKGWKVEKCSTSTTTDVVKTLKRKKKKTLKRKKKTSVKKETRELRKSFKEGEENLATEKNKEVYKCNGINICVKGFDASASNGFAHVGIESRDPDKALELDGSLLGGRRLEVRRAILGRPGYKLGCKTCPVVLMDGFFNPYKGFVSPEVVLQFREHVLQFKKRLINRAVNEEEVHQSNNQ